MAALAAVVIGAAVDQAAPAVTRADQEVVADQDIRKAQRL
jgi:hypothetical protein